jgi:hypothetical protein
MIPIQILLPAIADAPRTSNKQRGAQPAHVFDAKFSGGWKKLLHNAPGKIRLGGSQSGE